MEQFEKYLAINGDVFFIIGLAELLIILALVVYILIRRWENGEKVNNENNNDITKWQNECSQLQRKVSKLEKELERATGKKMNAQSSYSSPVYNNRSDNRDNETKSTDQSSTNGWEKYIENQKAEGEVYLKGNTDEAHNVASDNTEGNSDHVEETTNADGTIRTDVIFANKEYKYLETANGGKFWKLLPSDEKSLFRTWVENGVRKFEFHGNVDNALANFNAVFDDVCEIEGKQNGATQITNVEPGILSSQLKVEKKAIIKLT